MYSNELLTWAAKQLGCSIPAVQAVAEVESNGGGLDSDGRCKILYEAHLFHKFTHGKFREKHPELSCLDWKEARAYYKRDQWERFSSAYQLDPSAAIRSCSWGAFQILGMNYKGCGYPSPEVMATAMSDGAGGRTAEEEHLWAFVNFMRYNKFDRYLRLPSWEQFALAYNGPGYRQNKYDSKLLWAYNKFRGMPKETPVDGGK